MLERNHLDICAPAMIEAPDSADSYLLFRADTGAQGVVIGTSLAVAEQEHALLCVQGRIINTLGVGIYTLDLEQLADLAALYSWPLGHHGATHADVIFVSAARGHRHVWRNPPDQPIRTAEEGTSVFLTGTLDFTISDCRRFAHARLESSRLGDDEFYRTLDKILLRECSKLIQEEGWSAEQLLGTRDTLAQTLKTRLQPALAHQGLGDIHLKLRHVDARRMHKQSHAAETMTDVEGENIRSLNPVPAQGPDAVNEPESDQASSGLPPLREIEQALEQFEAEILELDAWGIIRENKSTEAGRLASESNSEVDESQVERFCQWLGDGVFHVAVDQLPTGPFNAREFVTLLRERAVTHHTLVWHEGMDDWTQAADVPEIVPLLGHGERST